MNILKDVEKTQVTFLKKAESEEQKKMEWKAEEWLTYFTSFINKRQECPTDFHDYGKNGQPVEVKSVYYHRVAEAVLSYIDQESDVKFTIEYRPERPGLLPDVVYFWNGRFWMKIEKASAEWLDLLSAAAQKLGISKEESLLSTFREGLLKELREIISKFGKSNAGYGWLNLWNGTLQIDLKTAETTYVPHNPSHYLTYILPYDYSTDTATPLFDKFFLRILPSETTRAALMEFLGSCFLPGRGSGKIMMAQGTQKGDNGKSTFIKILKLVLGETNISSYSLTELSVSEKARYNIVGKLLNWGHELGKDFDAENIKKMAGREPVVVREIYHQPDESVNYARLVGNFNELPSSSEITESFFKRLLIVPFVEEVPIEEQVPDLENIICATERCGILNQILEGARRLIRNNYQIDTTETRNARQAYRAELNPVVAWAEAVTLEGIFKEEVTNEWGQPTGETRPVQALEAAELYRKFIKWAETNDPASAKMSQTKFGRLAQMLPLKKERSYQFGNKTVYSLTAMPSTAG